MKKYHICLFLLSAVLTVFLLTAVYLWTFRPRQAQPVPNRILETETIPDDNAVVNQEQVIRREERKPYCLVAENGFLIVFLENQDEACLNTHMPLSEFPPGEQEKLTEGLWFDSMMEIFSYLESYSS